MDGLAGGIEKESRSLGGSGRGEEGWIASTREPEDRKIRDDSGDIAKV